MINILIVDDHLIVREGIKRIINETNDMKIVEEAATGLEAMDLIVSNMSFGYFEAPDLALRNCVEALTVGGEAILNITPYDGWRKDKVERLWTELGNVEMLEKKGILSLGKYNLWTGKHMNSISEGKNSMPSNNTGNGESAVCPYVSLNIKKLESITGH